MVVGVLLDRRDVPYNEISVAAMPKNIWLNHGSIVSETNGEVLVYQPNDVEFINDDDDAHRTVLPYGQASFGGPICVFASTVPLHYVRAASEWIAVTLNRVPKSSSSSSRAATSAAIWSNGLLAIIYGYYFD
jgi:hypothetical protein